MPLVFVAAIITLAAMALYSVLTFNVGRARGRYKIAPPAISGHPDFERYYRVQMNTLEQLMLFLPLLWVNAMVLSASGYFPFSNYLLGGIGALWLVGRIMYAVGYYKAPELRVKGFLLSLGMSAVLMLTGIGGVASMAGYVLESMAGYVLKP